MNILRLFISTLLFTGFIYSATAQSGSPQTRDLKNFSAISLSVPANVTLKQGDYSFSISASQELLDKIKTEVKNSELVIRFENNYNNHNTTPINIEISMPSLVALEVNGSGEINSASAFNGQHLNLEINGSGKIKLSDLTFDNFSAVINGSGKIVELKGNAHEVKMQVNGSGEITVPDFTGKKVECEITGSGDITVGASDELKAQITGSGDIRYGGSPQMKSVHITGSGSVTTMK